MIDGLYQAHRAAVLRTCSSILRNADDAADATQEVFLIALQSIDPNVNRAAARAWLLTVARNHCLDLLRRRKRLGKALVTLGPEASRGTDMETAVADRDFVDVVFRQLTKRERQALWQSAVESRPVADIASRLRLSYMAAAQVLHRARRHALQVAARVAVMFGIVQLGRVRSGAGALVIAQRLAAVVAVPLIVVSMNASSPVPHTASTVTAPQPSLLERRSETPGLQTVRQPSGLPDPGSVAPGSTAALNSATDALGKLLGSLSAGPAAGKAGALPAVSGLPSPPPIP